MTKTLKQINEMVRELQTMTADFNDNRYNMSSDEIINTQHKAYLKLYSIDKENRKRIDLIFEVIKAHHDELPQSVKNILEEYSNTER